MTDNTIIKSFRKLFKEYNSYSRKLKTEYGLNTSHISCLSYLEEKGSITISKLSNFLVLAPSTITSLIDELEKGSFIVRKGSKSDKRVININITSKGKKFLKNAPMIFEDKLLESFKSMPLDEQYSLNQLLTSLLRNMYSHKQTDLPVKVFKMFNNSWLFHYFLCFDFQSYFSILY